MFGLLKDGAIQAGLDKFRDNIINPLVKDYGVVKSMVWKDSRLVCVVNLLGLEEIDLEVSCGHIHIWDDASKVQFRDFKANKEFLQNALNKYATREIDVPDNALLRTALLGLRKILP